MDVPATKRFAIRRRLGEGGMGVVYEAFDEERRAPVALKVLRDVHAVAIAHFKREFRVLQGLLHRNLVALDELFVEDGRWFFTMELVHGLDFVSYVRGAPRRPSTELALAVTLDASASPLAAHASPSDPLGSSPDFDMGRLRGALGELAEGLATLHAAGKVHRDVKPSNVLVAEEGRVVLLDFGLATESSDAARSTQHDVVGTPAYMAPEQASAGEIGPPADLYAVGVMLYEILTGQLPFTGPLLRILIDKQEREAPKVAALAPGVPEHLAKLCAALLRFDPARRPTADDVRRAIASQPERAATIATRALSDPSTFVGRGSELDQLQEALDETARGRFVAVLLCGESGIGKSSLAHHFLSRLGAAHGESWTLEGRCYERETVPYKALDGIVDALSRRLAHMSDAAVEVLLPTRGGALAQVFPMFLRVSPLAKRYAASASRGDAYNLRVRAFLALRELFVRVAVRNRTVLLIDDLQWADDDGLRALAEIVRPPDAPPLLLLCTVRVSPGTAESVEQLARIDAALAGSDVRRITLKSLGRTDARELATTLLRRAGAPGVDAEAIADEASGHPLFLETLAQHAALGGDARDAKLEDALWARVSVLEEGARAIAELVAVAGRPTPQEVIALAARLEAGEFHRRAGALRVSNVVKTNGVRWADTIEPYHDRVREAVLARMDEPDRRARHEALALAFEASTLADPETLAFHWRGAGDTARAARHAAVAGDAAASKLAFDRAAQWYEQALDLDRGARADGDRRDLQVRLGEALANAGRSALAGETFEAATVGAPSNEAIQLHGRAADQLLRAGHVARGLAALERVLAAFGVAYPHTRLGAVVALVFYRLRLALRGVRFQPRDEASIEPARLTRIDACASAGYAIGTIDPLRGRLFTARALLLALLAGETARITRLITLDAGFLAMSGGGRPSAPARLELARELAQRGDDSARAFYAMIAGTSLYFNGRFREAMIAFERFVAEDARGVAGLVHERVTMATVAIMSLGWLGRFKELRQWHARGLREALERGDLYGEANFRTGARNLAWLVIDRPDLAELHARETLSAWTDSAFHSVHYYGLMALAHVHLYTRDAEAAYSIAREIQRVTSRSLLSRVQTTRIRARVLRAGGALAMVEGGLGDRKALLRVAAADARAIDGERMSWSRPFATWIGAALALRRGEREEAIALLKRAADEFEREDMLGYAHAARERGARLGGEGRDDRLRAEQFFVAEEVAAPERMIGLLLPGLLAEGTPSATPHH